ncbi:MULTISPECIES: GNAT family N-acetyltransferase [Bacillus]|nr:GNAT family N-acetyltransferase [Bacillus pseudomycoides]EEM16828.1 Acetyltransferase [Bacillus pseudomycoides DSM 12442]MED1594670.1 GNAT family N-acetyltransferase [Bacillus pseudomycoides]MED4711348.1 GNAT family N-acetyltransferase [Bacillus pseudomycoides]OOR48884.1 N-acetyltransferase [Bacillus pseudomycoides]PDY12145.1 N-acetyltransferase [Bacillus pseudomycoides]
MYNVEIRRPIIGDYEELHQLFHTVIVDTFAREGLSELTGDIENEIETKKQYLKCDFDSDGKNRYFLIAVDKHCNKIIGTIEFGPSSKLINNCTDGALKDLYEIGTVFVLPNYQRRGIGNLLLNAIFLTLLDKGIKEFCLDSGYTNAQKIWKKKFGEPNFLLKDYWGEAYDHMIWRKCINDIPIIFSR